MSLFRALRLTRGFSSAASLGVLLALLLVGTSCEKPGASRSLAHILQAGELRVGVAPDLPPLNMKNRDGEIVGLEIDIVESLGEAMGLSVRFVETPFAEILSNLERGDIDLAVAGLTMTPERNARVAFVGPYFISGTSVLSKSDGIANVQDPAALDLPDRTYAALEGSTDAKFVREKLSKAKLITAPDYETGVQHVIDGTADALLADFQVCNLAQWRHPDAELHAMMTPFTTEPLGIALPPNNPLLLNLVSNYLNTLENTGQLAQLKAKWLADGSWLSELP